jgi:hypothetical protein
MQIQRLPNLQKIGGTVDAHRRPGSVAIHREAADRAKKLGACYACQQHAGFKAVEAAGLSEPELDLYSCDRPECKRAAQATKD